MKAPTHKDTNIMKKLTLILSALLCAISSYAGPKDQPAAVTIMSYNIRNSNSKDGTNSWDYRFPATGLMIDDTKPDILCLQEAMPDQIGYLNQAFTIYDHIGVGEEDGKKNGESTAIYYKSKSFSLAKWGTFWLSETPDKPSACWESGETNSVTWAIMKDKKSGRRFMVVNAQICAESSEAQQASVSLILARIAEINKESLPVILAGDFRMEAGASELSDIRAAMKDARATAAASDSKHSHNGWGKKNETVDHIWYNGFSSCVDFSTIDKPYYERNFISSHFPVQARLIF